MEPSSDSSSMRGAERTLRLLIALNEGVDGTVSGLAAATGVSRPAVYRILAVLIAHGFVRRSQSGTDRYELTMLVRKLSAGYRDEDWIREAALPSIEALQREIVWPTDLATFHDNAMFLRETTRGRSPLTIDRVAVGVRLPMLRSATGRAYLASCANGELERILENLRAGGRPEDAGAYDQKLVRALIAQTRKRGYGEREEDMFPKTSAIAVPVFLDERPIACLNVTFIASVLTPDEAAARYLDLLRRASREIELRAVDIAVIKP
jgi:IclR family mhp operon transcriptional activator